MNDTGYTAQAALTGEELEIEIDAAGRVQVHVSGRPGAACLDYVEVFRALLDGRVEQTEKTAEFYQTGTGQSARTGIGQSVHIERK